MLQCAEEGLRILSWSVPLLVASTERDFGVAGSLQGGRGSRDDSIEYVQ